MVFLVIMPLSIDTEWQQLALYAIAAAVVLIALFSIPKIGPIIRGAFSIALLALCLFVLLRQAPFDPNLSRLTAGLGLDDQQVVGQEVRIRMSPDGHFWARASINGVERRMLIDSGATITAVSEQTAQAASVTRNASLMPVMMRTASGVIKAETGEIAQLTLGGIEASNLKTVISPALGPIDVLGMNFLSQLASWRVEGRTLILTPTGGEAPGPAAEPKAPRA